MSNLLFIILTEAEATGVRGETSPGAWLAPVPSADGRTWVLPERVLWDPEHASARPRLEALRREALQMEDQPPPE